MKDLVIGVKVACIGYGQNVSGQRKPHSKCSKCQVLSLLARGAKKSSILSHHHDVDDGLKGAGSRRGALLRTAIHDALAPPELERAAAVGQREGKGWVARVAVSGERGRGSVGEAIEGSRKGSCGAGRRVEGGRGIRHGCCSRAQRRTSAAASSAGQP